MVTQLLRPAAVLLAALLLTLWGATVASHSHAGEPTWKACQQSDVKALRFITVGQATLWRQDCAATDQLSPPLRLQFRYFRDVPGDAFADAADNFLQKNLTDQDYQALQTRFKAFNRHYRDIGDGDSYTLTYLGNGDLLLALNGETLTRENGEAFAQSYLRIWFGERPYSRQLKNNLLGR